MKYQYLDDIVDQEVADEYEEDKNNIESKASDSKVFFEFQCNAV